MVAVVFTVDAETVTGRPAVPNEEIAAAAAANDDVLIAFGSVDPHRPNAAEEVERLARDHGVRGFKFHPDLQAFFPNDRVFYPVYEAIEAAGVPACSTPATRGSGRGSRAEVAFASSTRIRCTSTTWRSTSPDDDRPRAPLVPVAGRGDLGRASQAAGLHRSVWLVTQVLPTPTRPLRQHAAARPGAVRLRLPADHSGPLARRLRAGTAPASM